MLSTLRVSASSPLQRLKQLSAGGSEIPPLLQQRLKEHGCLAAASRNGGVGFLLGSVLLVLEWNKFRRSTNEKRKQQFRSNWKWQFLRYPLFLSVFTAMFKVGVFLGRQMVGLKGVAADGWRRKRRRVCIALWAFLSGVVAQRMAPVFNWSWALYALIRSLLGLCRLYIPAAVVPETYLIYGIVHGLLPYFICINGKYVPQAYEKFFNTIIEERKEPWLAMYNHSHGCLPPCQHALHPEIPDCFEALVKVYIRKVRIVCLFYLKFYILTSAFAVPSLKSREKVLKRLETILRQTFGSTMFFVNSFYWPSRSHCWLWKNTPLHANRNAMLFVSWIAGTLFIQFERSASKRTDICLFTIWRILETSLLMHLGIEGEDSPDRHWLLGSKHFGACLFGMACAINCFVRSTDPSALKALERTVVEYMVG